MEKKEEKKVCCICGKEYEGYGYNPFPVKEEGCCCQSCNYSVVVPERWERHKAFQRGEATGAGKVYISGAIAHYDMNERKEAFSRAEEKLMAQGYDPVNPFRNGLPDEAHWRAHMRADIALLLACDYIYMLKDWELSKGAKLELDVASSCGIKVLFEKPFNSECMEEKQKVQVVFEFDRSEYDAYLFLMNQKKTKEVEQIWNTMSGEPVVADIDLFEEDSQSVKLMMISLAILSVEKKVKG